MTPKGIADVIWICMFPIHIQSSYHFVFFPISTPNIYYIFASSCIPVDFKNQSPRNAKILFQIPVLVFPRWNFLIFKECSKEICFLEFSTLIECCQKHSINQIHWSAQRLPLKPCQMSWVNAKLQTSSFFLSFPIWRLPSEHSLGDGLICQIVHYGQFCLRTVTVSF